MKEYKIKLVIPFSNKYNALRVGQEIEKAVGKHSGDAGAGFGYRDMTFYFKSKKLADKAYTKIKIVFIKYNLEIE
ncbi:hypothetical protein LCGC14_1740090 [marine sediment metagenome]|uniref:Uncharacterized protein n=1 Tax=marine sediment metagenome TaxID=412755 RepID=A0A0F9H6X9_9ZZZZ